MHPHNYFTFGYVGFLILLAASLNWYLRRHAPLDRGGVLVAILALAGFVAQAFLCFTGWMFFVQLAFGACIAGEFMFWSSAAKKT